MRIKNKTIILVPIIVLSYLPFIFIFYSYSKTKKNTDEKIVINNELVNPKIHEVNNKIAIDKNPVNKNKNKTIQCR